MVTLAGQYLWPIQVVVYSFLTVISENLLGENHVPSLTVIERTQFHESEVRDFAINSE